MNVNTKTEGMSVAERPAALGRNFFWMTWSGIISISNSVLVWLFMARMRDVDEVGRFTIVMGLYALFYGIVSLGLMPYLINEISRKRADGEMERVTDFLSSASTFLFISGILSSGIMTACGFLVTESWSVRISILVLSLAMIPTGLIAVSEAVSISYGRVRLLAAVTTVENLLRTIVPLILILTGFDIFAICLSFAGVRFIALIVYLAVYRTSISRFTFSISEFYRIASVCPTFAGTIIFASINWQAAIILLGYLSTEAESAEYGAASRFLIPVSILMASYANVIQPAVARHLQQTPENFGEYFSRIARYPLIAASIVAVASPFLSRQTLTVLFGENYANAAPIVDILALSVIPFCLVMVIARGLIATGSQHVDLLANILGVAVCLLTGALLIPRYGALGAAAAQFFSFLSMALVEIVYLTRKVSGFRIWRTASLSSASLIIIYLVLWNH